MGDMRVVTLSLHAMATRFELVLCGEDEMRLRSAGEEALNEVEMLDAQLSAFRPESEISGVNARAASEPVRVTPQLFRLLQQATALSEKTDGAFDITIGPLMRAWGFREAVPPLPSRGLGGGLPSHTDLEQVISITGMSHVVLDEANLTVSFDRPGVSLDLGAIGKGYAVQRAADLMRELGVSSALLHGGTSSVYAIGSSPDGPDWPVAIRHPQDPEKMLEVVKLRDASLSVSAVHGKSFFKGNVEFGHVIDPRAGMPSQSAALAAVVGPDATEGDALSTALLVLGKEWLPRLIDEAKGMKGWVV